MTSFGGVGSSPQSPVVFGGLVSGLNTASIIQQLMNANKAELAPFQTKVQQEQTRSSAFGNVSANLSALLSIVKNFADPNYLQGATATVTPGGTSPNVSATVSAGATVGGFQVTVDKLASTTNVSSPSAIGAAIDPTALLQNDHLGTAISAGTFTVNGAQVTIDPTTDTLNSVIGKIQAAAPGTTVSLVADSSGRNNLLRVSNAGGVTLGSGADTSNFLSATSLLASPAGTARTSTANLGVTQTGAMLQNANLVTPLSQPQGTFLVNGQQISYDATRDSLSTVLSRINTSAAGVTASYNAANDTVTFVNKTTGSTSIQFQDQTGNFLAAVGVAGTTQTLGVNAQYELNTGSGNQTYYSTTNTITNALPGVTLNLLKQGGGADTVTVAQDANGAVANANQFITQVNATLDFVAAQTSASTSSTPAANGTTNTTPTPNGPLAGNYQIQQIGFNLHQILSSNTTGTSGITSLSQMGITFGPVGSTGGTTNHLVLDETKFRAALQNNPAGVANAFSAFHAAGTLQPNNTNIQAVAGSPTGMRTPGAFSLTTIMNNGGGSATVTAIFTPSDGSPATTSVASNVTPASANTTLIPGMTLTFKNALQAGTDAINVTTPTLGIEARLEQFLGPLTTSGGQLTQLQNDAQTNIKTINAQIASMNAKLTATQTRLQNEFANMELALLQLNQQRNDLLSLGTLPTTTGL